MNNLLHRIKHALGWTTGKVETWWEPDPCTGKLMVGFRCDECGELGGVDEVPKPIVYPERPATPETESRGG